MNSYLTSTYSTAWHTVVSQSLSRVQLFETPWTVACQAPLSIEFSRPEYWSGQMFPSPGIFPTQGLNPGLLHCRWILYHMSYQGSPLNKLLEFNSLFQVLFLVESKRKKPIEGPLRSSHCCGQLVVSPAGNLWTRSVSDLSHRRARKLEYLSMKTAPRVLTYQHFHPAWYVG